MSIKLFFNYKYLVLPIFLRLFFVAFLFELGAIYSIQAKDNYSNIAQNFETGVLNNQHSFSALDNPLNNLYPFELVEKEEQNEINEDESEEDFLSSCENYFLKKQFHLSKNKNGSINFTLFVTNIYSLPLFIVFHSWKFHV